MNFENLKPQVITILSVREERDVKLKTLCQFLSDNVDYYNWVGF